jgi:hypothetical protein
VAWVRRSDGGWLAVVLVPVTSGNERSRLVMPMWLGPKDTRSPKRQRRSPSCTSGSLALLDGNESLWEVRAEDVQVLLHMLSLGARVYSAARRERPE